MVRVDVTRRATCFGNRIAPIGKDRRASWPAASVAGWQCGVWHFIGIVERD
jgi:hypothetical protein